MLEWPHAEWNWDCGCEWASIRLTPVWLLKLKSVQSAHPHSRKTFQKKKKKKQTREQLWTCSNCGHLPIEPKQIHLEDSWRSKSRVFWRNGGGSAFALQQLHQWNSCYIHEVSANIVTGTVTDDEIEKKMSCSGSVAGTSRHGDYQNLMGCGRCIWMFIQPTLHVRTHFCCKMNQLCMLRDFCWGIWQEFTHFLSQNLDATLPPPPRPNPHFCTCLCVVAAYFEEISTLTKRIGSNFNEGDIKAITTSYAPNCIIMRQNKERMFGKESKFPSFFGAFMARVSQILWQVSQISLFSMIQNWWVFFRRFPAVFGDEPVHRSSVWHRSISACHKWRHCPQYWNNHRTGQERFSTGKTQVWTLSSVYERTAFVEVFQTATGTWTQVIERVWQQIEQSSLKWQCIYRYVRVMKRDGGVLRIEWENANPAWRHSPLVFECHNPKNKRFTCLLNKHWLCRDLDKQQPTFRKPIVCAEMLGSIPGVLPAEEIFRFSCPSFQPTICVRKLNVYKKKTGEIFISVYFLPRKLVTVYKFCQAFVIREIKFPGCLVALTAHKIVCQSI